MQAGGLASKRAPRAPKPASDHAGGSHSVSSSSGGRFTTSNFPNAAILMPALRASGYSFESSIGDLVDNAIDARADRISILVGPDANQQIEVSVSDNGHAMSRDVLDQALRLGSDTPHDERFDLGKYGMGLTTAGHALAKTVRVLTREPNGVLLESISDIDVMVECEDFVKVLEEASASVEHEFAGRMEAHGLEDARHGTIVILSKCDQLTMALRRIKTVTLKNVDSAVDGLREYLGSTYRRFIDAGLQIFLNGERVSPVDPLLIADAETEIRVDEEMEFQVTSADGSTENHVVRVRVVKIPAVVDSGSERIKPNIKNQGFSILRNQREIAYGETFGMFAKHPEYNRFRGEIEFAAELDQTLGVRYTKRGIDPNQAFTDKLREVTFRAIRQIQRESKKAHKPTEEEDRLHREAEKDIAAKLHLLLMPPAPPEEIGASAKPTSPSNGDNADISKKEERTRKAREKADKKAELSKLRGARFEVADLTEHGPIYTVRREQRTVVITWNTSHPFYDAFVLGNNPRGAKAVDYLVYSWAAAELLVNEPEAVEFIDEIKSIVSSNMRTLLR